MQDPLKRGIVVLSVNGTERTDMRTGAFLWGLVIFGLGLAIGRWSSKKRA